VWELINDCLPHLRVGYFLYLLLLSAAFVLSYLFFVVSVRLYKLFQALAGGAYYYLLLGGKLLPFALFLGLVGVNLVLLYLIRYAGGFFKKLLLALGVTLNFTPLLLTKEYVSCPWVDATPLLQVVGLSYFVLNAVSALVDAYDGRIARLSALDYLVYALFFPKILAGPLVRYGEFSAELNRAYGDKSPSELSLGPFLIGLGVIKKWLADFVYQYARAVFFNPAGFSGSELLVAVYAYALYIFLDFSGYTDAARGSALLLGVRLPENFRSPYLATNFRDFWRRWHITLYAWIRDYVYIRLLGGSRKGRLRAYFNVLAAFTFSGVWHGNQINYVVWGFLHGLGVILSRAFEPKSRLLKLVGWAVTFNGVALLWVVFAVTELETIKLFFYKLFTELDGRVLYAFVLNKQELVAALAVGYAIAFLDAGVKEKVYGWPALPRFALGALLYASAVVLLNFRATVSPFLYEGF